MAARGCQSINDALRTGDMSDLDASRAAATIAVARAVLTRCCSHGTACFRNQKSPGHRGIVHDDRTVIDNAIDAL